MVEMSATAILADAPPLLRLPPEAGLLRFLTCGSVDDGKSTLIGRLLYETRALFEDQLTALEHDSRKFGTAGEHIDFALLMDGLEAEREQGITIDVAYRFFATDRRRFIVADTPGHQQYTRNMATGASTADLAVLLIDARKGVVTQTRRHSFIVSLLGIRHVVLAVNKMDLIDFDRERFDAIRAEYERFAADLGFASLTAIPLSARFGDNVTRASANTPWYEGPTLLEYLETVTVETDPAAAPFRMPVQWVNRPHLDFRGYAGTVAAGRIRPGDALTVLPSGKTTTLARIVTADGDIAQASAGDAVTLVLAEEIDVSRGDVLAAASAPAPVADQFAAHLVWMSETALFPGRSYLFKSGTRTVAGSVTAIKHRINVDTHEHLAAKDLHLNDVGVVNLSLASPLAFEPYATNRTLGSFIVIDRSSNETAGAGTIDFALRRGTNLTWQHLDVDRAARAALKEQSPAILWFTGLSGAGKSTIANLVERKLHAMGRHTYVLDGDNVRHGLNRDLGFTEADRVENIRRVAEVAKLFADAGLIVIASFISPYRADRAMARSGLDEGIFLEVFVDTPIEECQRRDPKGLYAKVAAGQISNFTGIDAPYEPPENPEIHLPTVGHTPESLADEVVANLHRRGIVR
ncbi:MAG TPA: sulfate adenylyltransferase subunit CysN [Acetobacteraceae bacterium]|nr:sulfate adenylyltransferase subunit CysN [Acetobacteraceae bacterium]